MWICLNPLDCKSASDWDADFPYRNPPASVNLDASSPVQRKVCAEGGRIENEGYISVAGETRKVKV